MGFASRSWCGLEWTEWVPLSELRISREKIPDAKGVYRVRVIGEPSFLVYIGQTGRLRQRLAAEFAGGVLADEMPYNDPHTAAPNLWAWAREEGWEYECSAAPVGIPLREMLGLECFLLWQYRLEKGESTLCNHGRFHPKYSRSGNKSSGRRGRRLREGETSASWGESAPPLRMKGDPTGGEWMGLSWSGWVRLDRPGIASAPASPGLYRILDADAAEGLAYIGETGSLRARLSGYLRRMEGLKFSYAVLDAIVPHYQRLELENDLIGAYYAAKGTVPRLQFLVRDGI